MDPAKIVVIGVKGAVLAFNQETGERLWTQMLKSSVGSGFVSVIADANRVYAHTGGILFCLSLSSGQVLWQDGLSGLGYGIASLTIPGQPIPPSSIAAAIQKQRQDSANVASVSAANYTQP